MIRLTLYHASEHIVDIPSIEFPGPRDNCDFGSGFYLAESKQTAEEWVIRKPTPVINVYRFEAPEKDLLYLGGTDWVKVIVGFRANRYKVKLKSPVICGPIANDRMNVALPLFLNGIIGDLRLLKCLDYCKLGDQYLIRRMTGSLSFERSYSLKGQELQRAWDRWQARRRDMNAELLKIQRNSIAGEKFIDDYLEEGDYLEP